MKLSILATLAISATNIMGCASVKKPSVEIANHDSDHNIPAIDQMIVEMKQAYIEKCYLPVAHRKPPENACQSELFQTLERRYHLDFNQNHVAMASNDLFFKDIDTELRKMLRSDPEIRQAARNGGFKNVGEMLAYYKDKYKFDTQLEQY
ncbi:MAG: hypothetical protein J6W22_06790 [Fibrobacter sp.]|nr:hypothetical protein [Fibrobacter sp.]